MRTKFMLWQVAALPVAILAIEFPLTGSLVHGQAVPISALSALRERAREQPAETAHASMLTAASPSKSKSQSKTSKKLPAESSEWLTHRVVPAEGLDDIASRYEVTKAEILRWNKSISSKGWIYAGQKLRIKARRRPPPREKISYQVKFGDTWQEIAAAHNVELDHLRYWNKNVRKDFRAGTKLVVYTNPDIPPPVDDAAPLEDDMSLPELPQFEVPAGGNAVGTPTRGKLQNGVQLPASADYSVQDADKAWGTSHTILQVQRAIADFRRRSQYRGALVVGAISRKYGGRLHPHRSHQAGRDVDIRLPRRDGKAKYHAESPNELDWRASWMLVAAFLDTHEVEYIFLEYRLQKTLMDAARSLGVAEQELSTLFQWPKGPRANRGLIRHAEGHTAHIHVRVKCSRRNALCES